MTKILVIGLGFIGQKMCEYTGFDGKHHGEFQESMIEDYDAVLNCAGIVGSYKCERASATDVENANVEFPIRLASACKKYGKPFYQLSTVGMYVPQVCTDIKGFAWSTEDSETASYNAYVESKLRMEEALNEFDCFIFRLPWLADEELFRERSLKWTYIQNTFTSIIYPDDLRRAILNSIDKPPDLYNLTSCVVYFPDFINNFLDHELPSTDECQPKMSSAVPVSSMKAITAGVNIVVTEPPVEEPYMDDKSEFTIELSRVVVRELACLGRSDLPRPVSIELARQLHPWLDELLDTLQPKAQKIANDNITQFFVEGIYTVRD